LQVPFCNLSTAVRSNEDQVFVKGLIAKKNPTWHSPVTFYMSLHRLAYFVYYGVTVYNLLYESAHPKQLVVPWVQLALKREANLPSQ
jgi:hypothetical protein